MKLPLSAPCVALLAVSVLLGCGTTHTTGKPLHQFPPPQSLSQIAQASGSEAKLTPEMTSVEAYRFDNAPPALPSSAPYPDAAPWDRMLREVASSQGATPSVAMQCLAQELARVYLEVGKAPDFGLHRYLAGRCGALVSMAQTVIWQPELDERVSLEAAFAQWAPGIAEEVRAQLVGEGLEVGFGIVRAKGKVRMVLTKAVPEVVMQPFTRLVGAAPRLVLRGRLRQPSQGLTAYVNQGAVGVQQCEVDPALALPEFQIACAIAEGDESAWIQITSTPPGRVLSDVVLEVLALRNPDAAQEYHHRAWGEAHPVQDETAFRAEVERLVNSVRMRAGMRPLRIAEQQSKVASSVVVPFFGAMLHDSDQSSETINQISLGLMAGWDVKDGLIQDATLVVGVDMAAPDAARWLSDALDRPSGRLVLLDPEAQVLALGARLQAEPELLASIALSYRFFTKEAAKGARAGEILERLAKIRKARGLGATVEVTDLYGVPEALRAIELGQASPADAMNDAMQQVVQYTGRSVRGLVWETHDLDDIEFPEELLRRGDLILGAGVTFYRAPGAAWGQYTVLFLVVSDSANQV